jgi:hypothetical protein
VNFLDGGALLNGLKRPQQVTAHPHYFVGQEILLMLPEYDMALIPFGVEHPLFPLPCITKFKPSSQIKVLGIRMSLLLRLRMVKTSKKATSESRRTSSSLPLYISINYHFTVEDFGSQEPIVVLRLSFRRITASRYGLLSSCTPLDKISRLPRNQIIMMSSA